MKLKANLAPFLLVAGVLIGLIWTNLSPHGVYPREFFNTVIQQFQVGSAMTGISLGTLVGTIGIPAFFFLVGLELKREFNGGTLWPVKNAIPPVLAAVLGVALPAAWYLVLNAGLPSVRGWAIPTATDVTFALAVFVVFGRRLPKAARTFLLTFAVIDDLIAVIVIALAFPGFTRLGFPFGFVPVVVSAVVFIAVVRLRLPRYWQGLLLVAAVISWVLAAYFTAMAGIEPGLLAVLLAFAVRTDSIHHIEARLANLVNYIALPLFGIYAASVVLPGAEVTANPVFWGVVARPVWKFLGVFLGGWLGMILVGGDKALTTKDLARVSVLGGIGFTVSLLVADVAFGEGLSPQNQAAAVLATFIASAISAIFGAIVLTRGHRAEATHSA
ncbi:MAG: hypothetical protein RJA35_839 [Actinomycetota bacterium]